MPSNTANPSSKSIWGIAIAVAPLSLFVSALFALYKFLSETKNYTH